MDEIEGNNSDEHQNASCHGIEKELDSSVNSAFWVSPDADQEIHRNQHDLPEYVKQDEIESYQCTHHTGFEEEEGNHELLDAILDGAESTQYTKNGQKCCQENQQEANPIDTQMIGDPITLYPRMHLLKLHLMGCIVEEKKQRQG